MIQAREINTVTEPDIDKGDSIYASVIIVGYNHRSHLELCLKSLMENRITGDEIILVDNDSSDDSVEYVKVNYPQVRIIRSRNNLGYAEGSNLGAREALGKYLVFLNPDTVVTPGWLEALIAALENENHPGLATSKILLADKPEYINTAGNEIHIAGLTMCRGLGMGRDELSHPVEVSAISGAAFVISQELFHLLGGFDTDFFMYMEDTDLSLRARLAGYRCLYVPDSLIYHDYALRFGRQKIYYQERNRYIMLLKSLRWPTLLLLTPTLFLMEIISWGFVVINERWRYHNKLKAYSWVFKNWAHILRERRTVQELRRVKDRELLLHSSSSLSFEQVDEGSIGHIARLIFNPLFFVLKNITLLFVWW